MDIKEILKKFWFIILIVVVFVGFVVVYAIDSFKNRPIEMTAKEVDGQYLIYSIGDQNYTADELYDELKEGYGTTSIYREFDRLVCDAAIKTTSEMENVAANQSAYLLQNYSEEELNSQLQSVGFSGVDEIDEYYIYIQKSLELRTEYLKNHYDEYVAPFMEEKHPKIISHILIKVADVEEVKNEDGTTSYVAHPTKEESEKLTVVEEELKARPFADVAKEYSEDSSSENGGLLGYFDDDNSTYVEVFKEAAKTLSEGENSAVITSEYGYHIIRCDSENPEDLYGYTDFINNIFGDDVVLYNAPLLEKAKELNITINDETLNDSLMSQISDESEVE